MLAFFFSSIFAPDAPETAVRATLADGQVLLGEVRTRVLRLTTGVGVLDVPLADVGEVVPKRGVGLGEAEGAVTVWLRNGSELTGRWTDPQLAMDISVGGGTVAVDLPMFELNRFQLQGGEAWPGGPVYRLRTRFGDDFLVDPARTTLVLENQLGTFSPALDECRRVAPVSDPEGDWRVELETGTVLIGRLRDDAVTVALPMGPEQVTVALADFVSLKLESWGAPPAAAAVSLAEEQRSGRVFSPGAPSVAAPAPARAPDGWFDNGALEATKAAQAEQ